MSLWENDGSRCVNSEREVLLAGPHGGSGLSDQSDACSLDGHSEAGRGTTSQWTEARISTEEIQLPANDGGARGPARAAEERIRSASDATRDADEDRGVLAHYPLIPGGSLDAASVVSSGSSISGDSPKSCASGSQIQCRICLEREGEGSGPHQLPSFHSWDEFKRQIGHRAIYQGPLYRA